ncbi:gastrula zinc finger protein XlCGF46.1-like [Esox lucius]|uniref:C2H2-type domain-containing protein n=1 Tax=Esox lucius TaxID=8010 RepID=A0A3P9AFM8_ESOLU|nr:gastrula zinc finger protein XlCGF46.1-like [Esox lucius]
MSKIQLLGVYLNERLTAAVVEILGAVEKTVSEYQEENNRLRRLLQITPEIKRGRTDSLQSSLSVFEEEIPPDQEQWSPSLGEEDLGPRQIKEEQTELRTSQEEQQLQELFNTKDSMFTPPCVKSECDQDDPLWSLTQNMTVENRESDSRSVDLTPFGTLTYLKGLDIPCTPPHNLNNAFSCNSSINKEPVHLDSSPTLDPSPTTGEHCYKPTTCNLSNEIIFYTGEKPFSCADCGKSFRLKQHLTIHKLTHTREKPFNCCDCGKRFSIKRNLAVHKLTHTREKPFICGDCGKGFNQKGHLNTHKLTHTREKPFSCGDCGKRFNRKGNLTTHKLTHTGEKPFSCDDCGKSFRVKRNLTVHRLTHTGEKAYSCGDCGKSFSLKQTLTRHKLTHTGEKYGCSLCGIRFTRETHLLKHVNKVHNERKLFEN